MTKAERITNKLSQFAAYAIQGDYQGVKEFGSDLRKLGLPVEHAPQVSYLNVFTLAPTIILHNIIISMQLFYDIPVAESHIHLHTKG